MLRLKIVALVTLFIIFDQVSSQLQFEMIFGSGNDEQSSKKDESKSKIKFLLLNQKNGSFVEWKNGSIPKGLWQKNVSLKVLVHSYSKETLKTPQQILTEQKMSSIANAYRNGTNKVNVLVVDWTSLAVDSEMNYKLVVGSVPTAGKAVAEFILKLVKSKHLENVQNVHIVGYGVGAHVAGVAGKEIHQDKKGVGKVGRISALDPAGVGFDDETGQKPKNKTVSLGRQDAEFVDVIHCNLGTSKTFQEAKWKGRYGSAVQAGHIDFYPNGGTEQNGCNIISDLIAKECHSKMCLEYFIKSIQGEKYVGCPCINYDDFLEGSCNCTLENEGHLMGEPSKKEDESKVKHYLSIENVGKLKKKAKPGKKKEDEESHSKKEKVDEKKTNKKKGTKAPEEKVIKEKEKQPAVVHEEEPETIDEEQKLDEQHDEEQSDAEPNSASAEESELSEPKEIEDSEEEAEEQEPEEDDWGT